MKKDVSFETMILYMNLYQHLLTEKVLNQAFLVFNDLFIFFAKLTRF